MDELSLTTESDESNEPNESEKLGPSEPIDVIRDCLRFESGEHPLYARPTRG